MIKYGVGFKTATLEVIDRELRDGTSYIRVLCLCGKKKWIRAKALLYTLSCGCMQGRRHATSSPLDNAVGQTFGLLTVLETWLEEGRRVAKVRCACGTVKEVLFWNIARRSTKGVVSCGCAAPGSPSWKFDPDRPRRSDHLGEVWRRWIGRGMVAEWANSWPAFKEAIDALGTCPHGYHLGRPDHTMPMGPGNAGWVCPSQGLAHSHRNLVIAHNGELHTATEWAAKLGISRQAMSVRLKTMPKSKAFAPRAVARSAVSAQAFCTICETLLDETVEAVPGGRAHASCAKRQRGAA